MLEPSRIRHDLRRGALRPLEILRAPAILDVKVDAPFKELNDKLGDWFVRAHRVTHLPVGTKVVHRFFIGEDIAKELPQLQVPFADPCASYALEFWRMLKQNTNILVIRGIAADGRSIEFTTGVPSGHIWSDHLLGQLIHCAQLFQTGDMYEKDTAHGILARALRNSFWDTWRTKSQHAEEYRRSYVPIYRAMGEALEQLWQTGIVQPNSVIVDAGCGQGNLLRDLLLRFCSAPFEQLHFVGVEFNAKSLAIARERIASLQLTGTQAFTLASTTNIVEGDVRDLASALQPLSLESPTVVMCSGVLTHHVMGSFEDALVAARGIRDLLADGGVLLLAGRATSFIRTPQLHALGFDVLNSHRHDVDAGIPFYIARKNARPPISPRDFRTLVREERRNEAMMKIEDWICYKGTLGNGSIGEFCTGLKASFTDGGDAPTPEQIYDDTQQVMRDFLPLLRQHAHRVEQLSFYGMRLDPNFLIGLHAVAPSLRKLSLRGVIFGNPATPLTSLTRESLLQFDLQAARILSTFSLEELDVSQTGLGKELDWLCDELLKPKNALCASLRELTVDGIDAKKQLEKIISKRPELGSLVLQSDYDEFPTHQI